MQINRHQYFAAGLVILLLGIQFRLVETFVVNEQATQFIEKRMQREEPVMVNPFQRLLIAGTAPRKSINPPQWLGWALLSIGSVLILHSFAMQKPAG